jgi:hypothetical protein
MHFLPEHFFGHGLGSLIEIERCHAQHAGAAFDRGEIFPCIVLIERRRALVTAFFGTEFAYFFR